ncbi:expressed unknown protein [Seminavis robusta]|uniref:Uncharacterized protein n=1 Tax=Seminavis robusta TaxID=568900 RepID=A0A9N8EM96_9STRA|nr:expressed unknown protein [Seminavis robusta]|eukprot:Sro1325_g262940.1 n/a (248) ;mRNA; f:20965-21708
MSDVFDVSTGLSTNQGSSLGYGQIESIIATTAKKKLEAKGMSVLRNEAVSPCRSTVSNYGGALALLSGTSCTTSKVINKTPTREIAENSLRSSQAFGAAVGTSHYMPTEIEHPEVRKFLNEKATDSEKHVYNTISMLHKGGPLLPVRKGLILSSDDTTEWIVEGLNKKNIDKIRFTHSSSYNGKGTRLSTNLNEAMATGIQVKLSVTMTAAGTTAPLFVSITGLNERELTDQEDNDSGVLILEIPGL